MYDPYQFGPLLTMIEKYHSEWETIQVRQGTQTLSMPTKQFRDDITSKKIRHSSNRLMRASAMNAVIMSDNNGIRINKNKASNKIDMMDATLDAYSIYMQADTEVSVTNEEILNCDFGF